MAAPLTSAAEMYFRFRSVKNSAGIIKLWLSVFNDESKLAEVAESGERFHNLQGFHFPGPSINDKWEYPGKCIHQTRYDEGFIAIDGLSSIQALISRFQLKDGEIRLWGIILFYNNS